MDVFLAKTPHSSGWKTRKISPKSYITYAGHYGSARKSELEDLRCCAKKVQVISHGGTTSTNYDCAKSVAIFLRTAPISGWCTFVTFCPKPQHEATTQSGVTTTFGKRVLSLVKRGLVPKGA